MFATANKDPNMLPLVMLDIIIPSLLIAGSCVPLIQGKVKMNDWYGFRIPKAFKSKENWLAINKYGGKVMVAWAIFIGLVFIPLAIVFKNDSSILGLLFVAPVFYILPVIQTYRYAAKLP